MKKKKQMTRKKEKEKEGGVKREKWEKEYNKLVVNTANYWKQVQAGSVDNAVSVLRKNNGNTIAALHQEKYFARSTVCVLAKFVLVQIGAPLCTVFSLLLE